MKKMMLCLLAVCCAVMFHVSAFAYIDPSVVSGLATAIAGVVVACSAAFFVIWRRVRSGVSKTLGIDENAGKEVEEDLAINEAAAKEMDADKKDGTDAK